MAFPYHDVTGPNRYKYSNAKTLFLQMKNDLESWAKKSVFNKTEVVQISPIILVTTSGLLFFQIPHLAVQKIGLSRQQPSSTCTCSSCAPTKEVCFLSFYVFYRASVNKTVRTSKKHLAKMHFVASSPTTPLTFNSLPRLHSLPSRNTQFDFYND